MIIAAGVAAPLQAFADSQVLPGVKQPEPIVQALKPEPDEQPATPGAFKVGNFDVKVSGSITVDIGVGKIKPPR
jgi:hypothetical protein